MRRFSQRNHLVTLSDINITPLLDLAFVLLIIFVITTPLLEQSLKMELPPGGVQDSAPRRKEDLRTVEIARDGTYVMSGKKVSLNEVESALVQAFQANKKLGVVIRADTHVEHGFVVRVQDVCQKNGILNLAYSTWNENR
jgi:biopolymer transport protein ExbD